MDHILFWLIEQIFKAIFHRSRNPAKTTQPVNLKPQKIDVWEEYRKKQDALHRAHETKHPKL